jgi:hypothetical protein
MLSPFIVISPLSPFVVGIILCIVNVVAAISAWFLPETTGCLFAVLVLFFLLGLLLFSRIET